MAKRIIGQRRGKGSSTYKAYGNRYKGKLCYNTFEKDKTLSFEIIDLIHSRGHNAPLMKIKYENLKEALVPAFQGAYIGQKLNLNQKEKVEKEERDRVGNSYLLKNISQGTNIYNIELKPGDSGKLVKSGGGFAIVLSHGEKFTKILLPSKKEKLVNNDCRAFVGSISGFGRLEKPFLKAGAKFYEKKKKNKLYPKVSGVAMSAYDHPHGSSRSQRKGRPTIAPRNAPPGRKVGMIRPRHTGRNK